MINTIFRNLIYSPTIFLFLTPVALLLSFSFGTWLFLFGD